MKKILLLLILSFFGFASFAQKIIKNPVFSATTASNVKITKIELHDTVTVIDFEVDFIPYWWIRVKSDKTHIQDSNGGEKLYVQRAEGIQLDEKHKKRWEEL